MTSITHLRELLAKAPSFDGKDLKRAAAIVQALPALLDALEAAVEENRAWRTYEQRIDPEEDAVAYDEAYELALELKPNTDSALAALAALNAGGSIT